jgi:hypothetical protein
MIDCLSPLRIRCNAGVEGGKRRHFIMFRTQHQGSYTDSSNSEVYSIKTTIMGNNDSRYVGLVGKQAVRPILGGRWSLATSQILGKCDAIAVKIATRQNEVEEVLSTRPEVDKALRVAAMQVMAW